jgi:hypothetical protein
MEWNLRTASEEDVAPAIPEVAPGDHAVDTEKPLALDGILIVSSYFLELHIEHRIPSRQRILIAPCFME